MSLRMNIETSESEDELLFNGTERPSTVEI